MSNYTKATNFAAKDSLPSGNAGKIIKGTEIDTEFNNIASAISSKADTNSPTFTGTPLTPTASNGTNNTQIASTAFVSTAITNERTATATLTNKTLTSPTISGGAITGITDLTVADGGTGASSITANSVILGNGSSALNGNLVAPGSSGNILYSNGTTWTSTSLASAAASLSGLKQIQSTTKTDVFSTTNSATWTDITGLSVSVTPTSASSKILILASVNMATNGRNGAVRLVRGSTAIAIGDASGNRTQVSAADFYDNANTSRTFPIMFVDSPNTTASTTYKIQGFVDTGAGFYVNVNYDDINASYAFRAISSIIVLEIL